MNNNNKTEIATLANGCFWCTEAIFGRVKGVKSILPGYAGGTVKNPSYDQVCTGKTGHAESSPRIALQLLHVLDSLNS